MNAKEKEGSFFMLQQFINQSVWAFVLEAAVLIGVLTKIGAVIHYSRLIKETEQMEQIHTKWLKALKKRFDNYEQLNFKVENAGNFVDKYLANDRICGLKSRIFLRIPLACTLLILLSACQGKEDWIFMTGVNLSVVFLVAELFIDSKENIPLVRTNILLAIEKGTVKNRKLEVEKIKRTNAKVRQEVAVSREDEKLSPEEMETVSQILKEWWEF